MLNISFGRAAAFGLWFVCSLASAQAFKDYAGTWQFTISGGDDGKGTAVVDEQGRIQGLGGSSKSPLPLMLSGQIEASGNTQFTATPKGMSSGGATFSGKLEASGQGKGKWQDAGSGLAGAWAAVRQTQAKEELPTQQTFRCEIDGAVTNDPQARADLMTSKSGLPFFRVLSNVEDQYSMDVKARRDPVPGAAEIVNEPGWSTKLRIARHSDKMNGRWNFRTLDMQSKRATGTLEFEAGAHRGTCRFDLFLFVADLARLPLPR
jgi:hypothetical protein